MAYKFVTVAFVLLNLSLPALTQGTGTQFITGVCTSDADCASGCCGFNTGKCGGAIIALERDGGCGFGDASPNDNAAQALRGVAATSATSAAVPTVSATSAAVPTVSATSAAVSTVSATLAAVPTVSAAAAAAAGGADGNGAGNNTGKQFITGACTSDADCASGCCGFNTGKCAGAIVAQERDGGCGFGDATPNDNATQALKGQRIRRLTWD